MCAGMIPRLLSNVAWRVFQMAVMLAGMLLYLSGLEAIGVDIPTTPYWFWLLILEFVFGVFCALLATVVLTKSIDLLRR